MISLSLIYQSPFKNFELMLAIPRIKMDLDKLTTFQGQMILELRKKVRTLEDEAKTFKTFSSIVPIKVLDLNANNGHNTNYSVTSNAWTNIPSAKGELVLKKMLNLNGNFI